MKNKKRKIPFNVLRKSALAGLCCITFGFGCVALTGCETKENKAEAKWYSGTTNIESVTEGVDGDYYFDTDDYMLYQKENGSWKLIDSNFGKIETDTGSFLTGATKPASDLGKNNDTYFDYNYKDYYQKINGVWTKIACVATGTSATDAITIASAEEFATLGSASEYTYYQLTANIDLRNLNETFNANKNLATNFVGEINGNGYTITMNDEASFSNVFANISGYFHDFILHFPNIQDKEINFSSSIIGTTKFKNITTTGSITVPSSGSNWSPYVDWIKSADTTFENCTNSLDVVLPTYGSLFVGGYATDGNATLRDEETYPGYSGKGVLLGHVKLNFINCKNTANVEMEWASMLYGNNPRFPQADDITITNCVNEGSILGYKGVGLFCGYSGFLTHVDRYGYEYQDYYFDYGDYDSETGTKQGLLAKVGDNLKNSSTGVTAVIAQKDLLTKKEESNTFVISNVTEGNSYNFKIVAWAVRENEVTHGAESVLVTLSKTYTANSAEDIDTGFEDLKFINKWQYDAKTNKTREVCNTLKVELAGGTETTLYIVTDNNTSERFYYVEVIEDGRVFDQFYENGKTVYEYDSTGVIIARSK